MKTNVKIIIVSSVVALLPSSCQNEEAFIEYPVALIHPEVGATGQPPDVLLEWENPNPRNPIVDTYQYDVYLGKSPDSLQLVAANLGSDLVGPSFECNTLELNTQYFWKVHLKAQGEIKDSPLWQFTTAERLPTLQYQGSQLMVYPADYAYETANSGTYQVSLSPSGATDWNDGWINTQILVNDFEQYPEGGLYIIAKYCDDLEAYGYDDWYLPAIVELDSLANNHMLSRAKRNLYRSSTEDIRYIFSAYALNISDKSYTYRSQNKYHENEYKCRCIRKE